MSRLPIRLRLTAVFAAAMVVVLAATAAFVYARLRADLDEAVNASLEARGGFPGDPEESFAQVLAADGRVTAGAPRESALTPRQARVAAREPLLVERKVSGPRATCVSWRVRGPATRAPSRWSGSRWTNRDEVLAGLIAAFAVGGPVAVLLVSLLAYALATAALRPVDAMRARAAAVSLADDGAPLPRAHDEVRRLGETLNAMLARLRGSFERERRFVADASHELRTPIAVLKTELETLLRRDDHPREVREALIAASAEADDLARLAEDLLVLARASEGRLAVHPERLDAAALLDGARERFAERAAARGRRIVRRRAGWIDG